MIKYFIMRFLISLFDFIIFWFVFSIFILFPTLIFCFFLLFMIIFNFSSENQVFYADYRFLN
ncbi:hypothetical protein EAE90_13430 [Photorhabdus caribbeanensis]|nr:hypothetical protein [Photorhabdus caribbeanensis]